MTARKVEEEGKRGRRRLPGVRCTWWGVALGCLAAWGLVAMVILAAFWRPRAAARPPPPRANGGAAAGHETTHN